MAALESPVILSQIVYELCAWVSLVELEDILSESEYQKLPASGRLSVLRQIASIDSGIPDSFAELQRFAREYNLANGPAVLAAIRNKFVHPTRKNMDAASKLGYSAMKEAGLLSIHYAELLILWICGYTGKYFNRTLIHEQWALDADKYVPWSNGGAEQS